MAPSEDPHKVLAAMKRIIFESSAPGYQDIRKIRIVSEDASSLVKLHDQLRDRHIRAAARRLLLAELRGDSTSLMLNRQAAAAGVVALCSSADQSPLGPITLTIRSPQIGAVIDWLTDYESA